MTDYRLAMWVVCERPSDYPQGYTARLWRDNERQDIVLTDATLAGIRAKLPPDLFPLAPSPGDDPCIVEVWL